MVLDAEQVAAAIASGCVFEPASPAAVQRLAMQRKVFTIDGAPMLAGRGDGLYETAGTLLPLIEQGRQLLAYLQQPPAAPLPDAPVVDAPLVEVSVPELPQTATVEPAAEAPQPEAAPAEAAPLPDTPVVEVSVPELPQTTKVESAAEAPQPEAAPAEAAPLAEAPAVVAPPKRGRGRPPGSKTRVATAPPPEPEPTPEIPEATPLPMLVASNPHPLPPEDAADARPGRRSPRWLTAGAERRGRRGQHWTARQK